jgi:hypothetical protein
MKYTQEEIAQLIIEVEKKLIAHREKSIQETEQKPSFWTRIRNWFSK